MDPLDDLRRRTSAVLCVECGKCTASCPLSAVAGLSARAIASGCTTPDGGAPDHGVAQCLTCAACEVRCPQGVHFTDYVRGLRQHLPRSRRRPCPHWAVLSAAARMTPPATPHAARPQWLTDDLATSEEGDIALFVGCLPLFDLLFADTLELKTVDIARAAVRLLNRAGIAPVVIGDERCCGHDLLWSGNRAAFEELARSNTAAFAGRGVRHILTPCAECCRTWRLDYPQTCLDYRPRVQHLTEFLAEQIEGGALTFDPAPGPALTYQDPCRLGRHLNVFEAPRRIARALSGMRLVEMNPSGVDAQCCGTSGFMYCDACSRRLQVQRLNSAAACGAQRLLTACPKCLIHFRCTQHEDRRRGVAPVIEVRDITEFAASMLPAERNAVIDNGSKLQRTPAETTGGSHS